MGAGPTSLIEHGLIDQLASRGIDARAIDISTDCHAWHTELHTGFQLHGLVKRAVREHVAHDSLPILLAGNCNTLIGLVAAQQEKDMDIAVVWLDAHADFHTPATDSFGSLDCQGLSMLTGRAWSTLTAHSSGLRPVSDRSIALVGARWIDDAERDALRLSEIHAMTVDSARNPVSRRELAQDIAADASALHVHIDADVFDPSIAPANDYAVEGGLFAEDARRILADALLHMRLASLSIASYDPKLDPQGALRTVLSDLICWAARST
jgi:arginase